MTVITVSQTCNINCYIAWNHGDYLFGEPRSVGELIKSEGVSGKITLLGESVYC